MLEVRAAGSDQVDVNGSDDSVEVLCRVGEGASGASGIVVVATGDVGPAGCTCVAYAASVPRAGPGELDPWVGCSAADEVASASGRASDMDEVKIDTDGELAVGCNNAPV